MRPQLTLVVIASIVAGASGFAMGNASLPSLPVGLNKENIDKILSGMDHAPKWFQQSLRSMMHRAAPMSTATHSRALAMDDGTCAMAQVVVPMAIVFGALPVMMMGAMDLDYVCAAVVKEKQYGGSGDPCPSKSKEQCYNACEWQGDACAQYGLIAMEMMLNPDAGSPARMMFDIAKSCNAMAPNKESCTGDCEFKEFEHKCDIGEVGNKKYSCEHEGSEEMMTTGAMCGTKGESECNGDCAWKPEEYKCDVAPAKFFELMFGKTSRQRGFIPSKSAELFSTCPKSIGSLGK